MSEFQTNIPDYTGEKLRD